MRRLPRHAFPLGFASRDHSATKEISVATASLLWIDRPFALTSARVLADLMARQQADPNSRILLGGLSLYGVERRLLCTGNSLASLRVDPEELEIIGDDVQFYSPLRWPSRPAEAGETLFVAGYPRDQWPAEIEFQYVVQRGNAQRFQAQLERSDMPGRLGGLAGAPVFRAGSPPELVGVVLESLFHNEVIRVQRANCLDACGESIQRAAS